MIRALVVDDSAFMRKAISMMLESDPDIVVIDTARNGAEGLEKVRLLKPDVVTMDVEMPIMDGISAVREIMKSNPCPVLMISSVTQEGAPATIEALQAGAVDFIPKQSSYASLEITKIQADLVEKIKQITRSRCRIWSRPAAPGTTATGPVAAPHMPAPRTTAQPAVTFREAQLLAIGVSTGGPFALQKVIPSLPANLPVPVVVVQHMPPHFTRSLAERLNSTSPLKVVEAEHGMRLETGTVYIAPGGKHLCFKPGAGGITLVTNEGPSDALHKPSVDVMLRSAHHLFGGKILTVIMTGMGKDGLEGVREIKKSQGKVFAQDEMSCVVYGMPRAVVDAGLADAVVPLDNIAESVTRALAPGTAGAPRPFGKPAPAFH